MRNRNSLIRERREAFRDARLIVIASEGKDTERIYFETLAKEYANPRVHVRILERNEQEKNNSSPDFSDRAIWYRFTNPCLFFVVLISVSRLLYLFLCAKSVFKKRLNV